MQNGTGRRGVSVAKPLLVVGSCLLVGLVLLAGYSFVKSPWQTMQSPRNDLAHADWTLLLRSAQAEATRIDKDSVLESVSSSNSDPKLRLPCPDEYRFYFLRPSGTVILITMIDTSPPTIQYVNPDAEEMFSPPSSEYLAQLKEALSNVKLGPREVCEIVKQEGVNYRTGPEPHLNLDIQVRDPATQHSPRWSVWYMHGISPDTSPVDTLILFVSQTGEVVDRKGID